MKKILFILIVLFISFFYFQKTPTSKEIHREYLTSHIFSKKQINLRDNYNSSLKLPPNQYFENENLMEMNPHTGKVETEKLYALQTQLNQNKSVPGSNSNMWEEKGPNNVPGRTRAILFDPNDPNHKRVFAGGVSGGLWVIDNIEDANAVWQRVGIPENLAVSSITVDAIDSQVFYLGTGESYVRGAVNGNGVWKSMDGGTTWNHIFGGSTGETISISNANFVVNSPVNISGTYSAIQTTNFGPALTSISGNLVVVNSGGVTPTEGCTSILNSLTGKIAVIDRGTCDFVVKVKNAQLAGAIAVIVVNSVTTFPFNMGGTDTTINIPAVMISKSDGSILKNALNSGNVNVTLNPVTNDLPVGVTLIPGKFHVNDIITRINNGVSEIFASIGESSFEGSGLLGGEAGLYKSIDGGNSWALVNLPLMVNGHRFTPNDLLVAPDNKLWVSTINSFSFGGGGGTIFSSNDGNSFVQKFSLAGAGRTEMAVSTTNPNKFYVLLETNTVKLIKTTDGFGSTIDLTLPVDAGSSIPSTDFTRGQAGYSVMIAVDPNNDEIVYTGGIDIFRSSNGGDYWSQISKWTFGNGQPNNISYVHADIHNMIFDPLDNNKAIVSTDGGVFYANSLSTAGIFSTAFSPRAKGYNTTQFYRGAISQDTNQMKLLGGSQDNGTNFIVDANYSISSSEIFGGDGTLCFIDKDGQYMIVSIPRNRYIRTDINGNLTNYIVNDGNTGSFINQAALDDNLDILYTNSSTSNTFGISKFAGLNTIGTPIRTNFSNAMLTRPVTAMKVSPYTTDSTTLFLGTDTGSILKLTNANTLAPTWEDLTPEPYDAAFLGSISSINFGANEDEILVTFHNYGVVNVYLSQDGGQTWQNKEGNLPDLPVKDILMNPLLNDEVIIATNLGVWKTNNFYDALPIWTRSHDGMQNVKVTSFDLRTADNTILASTYGRGFFVGQFTDQSTVSVDENLFNTIKILPTVSNGNIKIETSVSNISMRIFDINGKLVFSKSKVNNNDTFSLNIEKGVYFVNLTGNEIKESHKIIIK